MKEAEFHPVPQDEVSLKKSHEKDQKKLKY
jgi:hypothetical protein